MDSITFVQRKKLFRAVGEAARELEMDPEVYRKKIMREELGVEHLADVSRTDGFERLMMRIHLDAGDYEAALSFSTAEVRRYVFWIKKAAGAIVKSEEDIYNYLAGLITQMGFSNETKSALTIRLQRQDGWDDFTPIQLKKIIASLNCHLIRLRLRHR